MPVRIAITNSERISNIKNKNINYDYPGGFDFKPGTMLHDEIVAKIHTRALEAQGAIKPRYAEWEKIDHTLTSYVNLDDAEKKVQEGDDRKPLSIVVPVSYATIETLLTYYSSTFLDSPIFRYDETEPDDLYKVAMLEHVIDFQTRKSRMGLDLHTNWRDGFAYGMGVSVLDWKKVIAYRTRRKQDMGFISRALGIVIPSLNEPVREEEIMYEGNYLIPVDVYNFLPDPNVAIDKVDDMEFIGYLSRDNYFNLLTEEEMEGSSLFNIKYLSEMKGGLKSVLFRDIAKGKKDFRGSDNTTQSSPVDLTSLYIKIIPSDWELGDSDSPEIWLFTLAADSVLVQAEPLGFDHNQFPVIVNAPEYDGHGSLPVSKLEIIYGMQHTIDWLISSHIANVRKAIHDVTLVDPYLVNMNDVTDPKPGGIWRLRRAAWGRGVKDVAMQFPVNDVTRGHIADTGFFVDLINRISSSSDILQGVMRSGGERRSATEARDAKLGALSRIAKSARITAMQAHYRIANQAAYNTRQLMSEPVYVNILGRKMQEIERVYGVSRALVRPQDIDMRFDVVANDGTKSSVDNPDLWIQLLQTASSQPSLSGRVDMFRLFLKTAESLGAKNLEDFEVKVQQDEQIGQEVQKGNLVPTSEVPTNGQA